MFSLLNKRFGAGNHLARLCKFLNSLPQFFHSIWRRFPESSYLIESEHFRKGDSAGIGLPIALLVRQPALHRIRSGKE
jgi:hypothetical protein